MDQMARVARMPVMDDEVFVSGLSLSPGGSAANFAVMLSRLGTESGFVGKVGRDPCGTALIQDLKKEGVDTRGVKYASSPTGTAFIAILPDGQRAIFAFSGAANELAEDDIDLPYLSTFSHLHLADLENIQPLVYAARHFDGTKSLNMGALIAESKQKALNLIKRVDILICSEEEANRIGAGTASESLPNTARLLRELGPSVVVITRGPRETLAFDGERLISSRPPTARVVDTTGSGDTFSAAFIHSYLNSRNLKHAVSFANKIAALSTQFRGARGLRREHLKSL